MEHIQTGRPSSGYLISRHRVSQSFKTWPIESGQNKSPSALPHNQPQTVIFLATVVK